MQISDFEQGRPIFEPTKFFAGRTSSSGVMENRDGAPVQRVTTETSGHWEGTTLGLEQDLVMGAKREHRSWRIQKLDAHHYDATANDIVGAVHGEAYGNVFHWT